MSNRRFICLMPDGKIKLLKRQPVMEVASWMELKPSLRNAEVLEEAADFCDPEEVRFQ